MDDYYQRNKEKVLKKLKEKYRRDESFREKVKERYKKKYREDPDYRQKTIERARERNARIRD